MSRSRRRRSASGGGTAVADRDDRAWLRQQLDVERNNLELLAESFADLERQLSDPGWLRMSALFDQEFSPEGLVQTRAMCRLYAVKSPLIRRGLGLRGAYIWGQGVEITARANGKQPGEQDVQAVVDAFLTDSSNQQAVTGPAARERLERCLGTDGELYLTLWTRPSSGEVQARVVGADDIAEIIANPDDRSEPWFYRRRWVEQTVNPATGATETKPREALYPCVDYRPKNRPKMFGPVPVMWDAPMLHVRVNELEGWQRGVPDAYAAIDWARAYKEFLEDWARLCKSLSRFAWKLTAKGSTRAQAKTRLATAPTRDPATGEAFAAGATAITPPDQTLEAIPKTGAVIDAESGRPLAAMVAAALDVPVTMLLADPGVTGARATAETLDQPTERAMGLRRSMWAGVYQRMLRYVITESVRASKGALKGIVTADDRGRESVALAGDTPATVDIAFPDLDDIDQGKLVHAVVEAASTMVLPPEQVCRLLLTALGVNHVDEIVEALVDDEGRFIWPDSPLGGAGRAAVDRDRDGDDPADVEPGRMGGDEDDDVPEGEPADDRG